MNISSHEQYNQTVINEAFDADGFSQSVTCPNCGKEAQERTFDMCYGGAINQHEELECSHCGFHKCDREFCSICEEANQATFEAEVYADEDKLAEDYLIADSIDVSFEGLRYELLTTGYVDPVKWTEIKEMIHSRKGVHSLCCILGAFKAGTASEFITSLKRLLLDENFNRKLDYKIDLAHFEIWNDTHE